MAEETLAEEVEEVEEIGEEIAINLDEPDVIAGEEKKDPKDNLPEEGSKRWNEIYSRMSKAEVALEQSRKEKGFDTDPVVLEMRRHNQALVAELKSINTQPVADKVGEIDKEIATLQSERKLARKEMEHDLADELMDKITELKMSKISVKEQVVNEKPIETEVKSDPERDTAVAKFESDHPWYGKNVAMKGAAQAIDEELKADPKWVNKSLNARFVEVGKRVEEIFKYGENPNKRRGSAVEGASGTRTSKSIKTVNLSNVEMELAKGFGLSPEDYATQKAQIGGNK